jgi:hypothetical protein
MSTNPTSKLKYAGQFSVSKVYPKRNLRRSVDGYLYDASTVSFILPFSEAMSLADAIQKASDKNPETVEIKVERRKEKIQKRNDLYPATVTFKMSKMKA